MKYLVVLLSFMLIVGCATQIKIIEANDLFTITPRIDTLNEVEIGTSIVSKQSKSEYKAIMLTNNVNIKFDYIFKEIKEGDIFINDSYTKDYKLYSNIDDQTYGIAIPKNGGTSITFIRHDKSIVFYYDDLSIKYLDTLITIPRRERLMLEFIYNGKLNNSLKFTYREYLNDNARPAFTQDLQYDLNEGNIIGFKGLRIEIISATNIKLKYKVLNYFK